MYTIQKPLLATICMMVGTMLVPLSSFASENFPTEPPPANQAERTPPPQLGQVWNSGHWDWTGHAYTWRRGAWRDAMQGFHWVEDRWEKEGEQWHHIAGHWEH